MATKATLAYGSTIEWSFDGGTTYVGFAEATAVVIPGVTPNYIDVTNLDSPNGFLEFIPGMKDAGEVTIPANRTPALMALVFQHMNAGTLVEFRITLTPTSDQTVAGDIIEFSGYVSLPESSTNAPDAQTMEVAVKITGEVTYAEGS